MGPECGSGSSRSPSSHTGLIRLTTPGDDRGDGITAIELDVVDRDHTLQAAMQRGLTVDGESFILCGTRFLLNPS